MSVGMSSPGFFTKKNNEKINNLKDIMRTLALSVWTLQENAKIEAQFCPQLPLLFHQRTTDEILIVTIKEFQDLDFLQEFVNVYILGRQAIF